MADGIDEKLGKILATQEIHMVMTKDLQKEAASQREVLTRNTLTVEEHHKRSTMLEAELKRVEAEADKSIQEVRDHVIQVEGAGKLLTWIAKFCGLILTLAAIVKLIVL